MIVDYSLPVSLILFWSGELVELHKINIYHLRRIECWIHFFQISLVYGRSVNLLFSLCLLYILLFQVAVTFSCFLMKGENYDLKQIQQPHDSHMHALSQLCPSNLNGGSFLT